MAIGLEKSGRSKENSVSAGSTVDACPAPAHRLGQAYLMPPCTTVSAFGAPP